MSKGGRDSEVDRERAIKGGKSAKGQSGILKKANRTELRKIGFENITHFDNSA